MTDKRLEELLRADHRSLADQLTAAPAEKTVAKMKRRAWRKSLIVAAAIVLGAAVAVAQLPALTQVPTEALGRWAQELSLTAAAVLIGLVLVAAVLSLPDVD